MSKTTFFSDHVRKCSGGRATTRPGAAKQRPNDRCACGSGKKFKKCCRGKYGSANDRAGAITTC